MAEQKNDWKTTLNLPQTAFPMKASLSAKEPEILKKWEETDLYNQILTVRQDAPKYILHDGPPYANGNIHLGHALNKILKDFIVKTKSMEGHYAPYVPGWDCHGLPIEHKVDQEIKDRRHQMSVSDVRKLCREYAQRYVGIQRDEFKRLGVLGQWQEPYTTLDTRFEGDIVRFFNSFVKKGNVTRKKRPVYWCVSCQTALAEAEVEYHDHSSPSITVKFALENPPAFLSEAAGARPVDVLIWTTTPWTIPANLAIALHPDFDYALFEMNGACFIAASQLIPALSESTGQAYRILREFKGEVLKGFRARHPLFDRDSLIINTDYVTLDAGTGCVHTAPGHGDEDYKAGIEYGLDIYSPVRSDGTFDETAAPYTGISVFKANPGVVEDLREKGRLLHQQDISHSYPHCWRCRKPVIFRATEQWFIAMDQAELRLKALEEIKKVNWLPDWGEERIANMIANRPDWCISRQRDWGVPIPVFYCTHCENPLVDPVAIERIAEIFSKQGSDSWYTLDISEFITPGSRCQQCGKDEFRKGEDILDVWFESGSSWAILNHLQGHRFPADLYVEGGDQYRGWFHSSLLVGVSAADASPYRQVITHGWALDEKGKAMSKSLGNVIKPQTIIDQMGAEILRMWIALVNYREDIRLGKEILSRVTETYRKIRNTWRFMLAVLPDFDPDASPLIMAQTDEVDRYILVRWSEVKARILGHYNKFEYHQVTHSMTNFFNVDLSPFYLHVKKDQLYCNDLQDSGRRAAQAVIFHILCESLRLMAPILAFTTEEAWEHVPAFAGKASSVHCELFPAVNPDFAGLVDGSKWGQIMALRDRVLKEIETARNEKLIGDSLEARVSLQLDPAWYELAQQEQSLLKLILVVSDIRITAAETESIRIERVTGSKCPRCWNRFPDPSAAEEEKLCSRCQTVTDAMKARV
jgi:isoleucyl-tRNA synthetase